MTVFGRSRRLVKVVLRRFVHLFPRWLASSLLRAITCYPFTLVRNMQGSRKINRSFDLLALAAANLTIATKR
jgi:hypothetical protein